MQYCNLVLLTICAFMTGYMGHAINSALFGLAAWFNLIDVIIQCRHRAAEKRRRRYVR